MCVIKLSDIMIVCLSAKMPSENFSLCINALRLQNKDFSNLTFIFSCYIVAFGKNVVTLHPDKWRTKSEEFKSRFPIKGHERKTSGKWVKNVIRRTAHRQRYKLKFFTLHSSLSKQLRFKSASNPLQVRSLYRRYKGREAAKTRSDEHYEKE